MGNVQELQTSQSRDIFSFSGGDMVANMKMAEMMAESDLVPTDYKRKPGNIMVCVQMGQEVGLKPMQALQGIAVINGRPSIWGDALIGLVRNSRVCEYVKETFNDELMIATCESKRVDSTEPHIETFSLSDAKEAGLLNKKGPWQQYRKRMLKMRARGFNLRDNFADVLKGLAVAEEVQDYQPLKQVNSAPTQSAKANKIADLVASEPEAVEGAVETKVEVFLDSINRAKTIQELSGLAVGLAKANSKDLPKLRSAWTSRKLEIEGVLNNG